METEPNGVDAESSHGDLSFDGPEFGVVPTEVFADKRLSVGARLTLGLLFTYRSKKSALAWPGQQVLADTLGGSKRDIVGYLKELHTAGWITVTRRGQGKTNQYTVHWTPTLGSDEQSVPEIPKHTSIGISRNTETHVNQDGNIPVNIPSPAPKNGAGPAPRQPSHPAVALWQLKTGYRPLPDGRKTLMEMWEQMGAGPFEQAASAYLLAGKNPRNIGYFQAWVKQGCANGARASPRLGVRRMSSYSPEELRKGREADRGQEWQPPPD